MADSPESIFWTPRTKACIAASRKEIESYVHLVCPSYSIIECPHWRAPMTIKPDCNDACTTEKSNITPTKRKNVNEDSTNDKTHTTIECNEENETKNFEADECNKMINEIVKSLNEHKSRISDCVQQNDTPFSLNRKQNLSRIVEDNSQNCSENKNHNTSNRNQSPEKYNYYQKKADYLLFDPNDNNSFEQKLGKTISKIADEILKKIEIYEKLLSEIDKEFKEQSDAYVEKKYYGTKNKTETFKEESDCFLTVNKSITTLKENQQNSLDIKKSDSEIHKCNLRKKLNFDENNSESSVKNRIDDSITHRENIATPVEIHCSKENDHTKIQAPGKAKEEKEQPDNSVTAENNGTQDETEKSRDNNKSKISESIPKHIIGLSLPPNQMIPKESHMNLFIKKIKHPKNSQETNDIQHHGTGPPLSPNKIIPNECFFNCSIKKTQNPKNSQENNDNPHLDHNNQKSNKNKKLNRNKTVKR